MAHGLPGEPGADAGTPNGTRTIEQYSRRRDQHRLDTWDGLLETLQELEAIVHLHSHNCGLGSIEDGKAAERARAAIAKARD